MCASVTDKTVIDLDILKSKYNHDSLPHHLWYMALDCKRRRDAFWRHHKHMRVKSNIIGIPLLILSSVSGITSVLQVGNVETGDRISMGLSLPIAVSFFSVSAAILTALQKYFRYAERSEHSKHMAKNYARISKRIENNLVLIESAAIKMEPSTFLKFMEEVQKDTESLLQETDDMPKELIAGKNMHYDLLMKEVKNHKKEFHTPFASSAMTNDIGEMPYMEDRSSKESHNNAIESIRGMTRHIGELIKNIKDIEDRIQKASEEGQVNELVNLKFEVALLKESLHKEHEKINILADKHDLKNVAEVVMVEIDNQNV